MRRICALPALAAMVFTMSWLGAGTTAAPEDVQLNTTPKPSVGVSPTKPNRPTPATSRAPISRETGGERLSRAPLVRQPPAAKPKPRPKVVIPAPAPSGSMPASKPKPTPTYEPKPIYINSYMSCGYYPKTAQPCIDKGLTLYHGNVLAGHNYMGYQWLGSVPIGKVVKVTTGAMKGTYKVFRHTYVGRQSGSFPNTYGADLVLQTCKGDGTSFSLLNRI